jgi:two-component system response regulator DctR
MSPHPNATVYVIDDDASVRDALAWLLRSRRLLSETFDSAESFEAHITREGFALSQPACALLDVRMGELSGLALFERLIERQLPTLMPVIFLTGHADVATAVKAVKRGAFDFCEKPFSDNALIDRVEQAIAASADALAAHRRRCDLGERIAGLTEREQEVMRCVVDGLANKQMADTLGISVRTVEVHRARIFEKMRVRSAVELANLLHETGLP